MKTVKMCDNSFTAELTRGRLSNEGIESQVINKNLNNVISHSYGIPSLRTQVVVADSDYDRAMELLEGLTSEQIVCPACSSSNICFGMWKRKNIGHIITSVFFMLLGAFSQDPGKNSHNRYYCKDCKHVFRL